VAVRKCPQCLAVIPAGESAAYSDSIECPHCKARLEVAHGSRLLSTWLGLLVAYAVWRLTRHSGGMLGWALPVLYAFLAYSVVSALGVMFSADLRMRPAQPDSEPVHAPSAHGAAHH